MISKYLVLNIFILRRPGVANFADIIKILTMFIKKVRRFGSNVPIYLMYLSVFSDMTKFADFRKKSADVSRTQVLCHVVHIFFGSSLGKV